MKRSDYRTTQVTYDLIASDYADRDEEVVDESPAIKEALDWFIGVLPPSAKVLDVGVGAGRDSRYFFSHGLRVVGIDFSPNMIAEAKNKQSGIDYRIMDLLDLDLGSEIFDGIWANASLHHLEKAELPGALKDLSKYLKPEGRFVLIVKHGSGEGMRNNRQFGRDISRYFAYYKVSEVKKQIKLAGLVLHEIRLTTSDEWIEARLSKPSEAL